MQAIVLKDFVVHFHRNQNRIASGTLLVSDEGEYWRFRNGLGLLLTSETIARLLASGIVAMSDCETTTTKLQAAE